MAGIKSINLPAATAALEVLVHEDMGGGVKRTARMSIDSLLSALGLGAAAQLGIGDGLVDDGEGSLALDPNQETRSILVEINGGGEVITTGQKDYMPIDIKGKIVRATIIGDTTGSIEVDVWRSDFGGVGASICGGNYLTLSSEQSSQDDELLGWSPNLGGNDVLVFNVNSVSSLSKVFISLKVVVG